MLEKDYELHGIVPVETLRTQVHHLGNISHLMDRITLHGGSLDAYGDLVRIIGAVQPTECYHLAERCAWENEAALLAANIADIQCLLQVLWEL